MEIEKYDKDRAMTAKLDNMLKQQADKGKLNYLLIVKLKKTNQTFVSSHGSEDTVRSFKNDLKRFIKKVF